MKQSLDFVKGAIAKKDTVQSSTFFSIKHREISAFNGVISLGAPFDLDLECSPKAFPLINAIAASNDSLQIVLDEFKLRIKSGKFSANIDCSTNPLPETRPSGQIYQENYSTLLDAFKTVYPFIGSNASTGKSYTMTVRMFNGSMIATNNECLIEQWVGLSLPDMAIPVQAVKEFIRINETPISIQCDANSLTFHYEGNRWFRTILSVNDWPDHNKIFAGEINPKPIDKSMFKAIDAISSFCDNINRVYIESGLIRTNIELNVGASHAIEDKNIFGIFNYENLKLVKNFDFSDMERDFQSPAIFFGNNCRVAISKMRA